MQPWKKCPARRWTLELPSAAVKGPTYECACHEGNYAIEDILAGARKMDAEVAGKKQSPKKQVQFANI
jgi:hypothetical protein